MANRKPKQIATDKMMLYSQSLKSITTDYYFLWNVEVDININVQENATKLIWSGFHQVLDGHFWLAESELALWLDNRNPTA